MAKDVAATRLELVQALRLSTTPASRKLELVMSFIESYEENEEAGMISMPQVIGFLSEWAQTALIKSKAEAPAHMDPRYWTVLSFCLNSGYLHHITGVSPSLMRPLLSCISSVSLPETLKQSLIKAISVLFREYSRPFRSNLDSWVSLTCASLKPDAGSSDVELVSEVLEGFSRTIASHSNPSKVFQSVVSRVLESLLIVIKDQGVGRVAVAAEEIVENGVFHPAHVGGFYEVCVFLKGNPNGKKDQRSYHRTLFQKVDEVRKAGNNAAMVGLGKVFKIYAKRWKTQQVALSEDVYGVRGQGKETVSVDKGEANAEGEESVSRKHATTQTDALFTVLAEFLGPLILELSSPQHDEERVCLLMLAANELLTAAKEAGAYKSIEDTLSLTYFNFLQEVCNLAVKIGTGAFDVWSNGDPVVPVPKKKRTEMKSKKRTEGVFSEVVFALQHLLELEYRVFEQQLSSIWMFMFKMVAPAIEDKRTTSKALEFCCGLINMYSDLRQVEIPIFHLTDTLAELPDVLSDAVEKTICTKPFLMTLGSVIHKLPEGQVASLLRGLKAAVAKTLGALQSDFRGATKGVLEVYTCILQNANVTSSNSVLAGGAVRELIMDVLAPSMTELVDANEVSTESLFLLLVYASSRSLLRQCLSLMPPKAARKATLEVEVDLLVADETEGIAYLEASGFLMPLQRGSVRMSKFLKNMEGGVHMIHTVEKIALQSMVDLERRVWALKFLISKAVSSKKYMKILRSLEKEGAKLVSIFLKNLAPIENEEAFVSSVRWNGVMTTLDSNTVSIARWRLICETVDVWSAFANEEHLENFVMVLLRIGKAKKREEAGSMDAEEVDLHVITEDILRNLDFFEIEGIRRVFSSAFLEELKKILLTSFKEDCPVFRVIDETTPPPAAAESTAIFIEKVKLKMDSIDKLSRKGVILSKEQQKTLNDCSFLLNLLSSLPCGYLPPADIARCAHIICQLEIFLADFLLGDGLATSKSTNSSSDGSRLVWANAIISCRRALDSLANSSATSEPGTSDFTRTLFGSAASTQCVILLPEIVTLQTRDDDVFYSLLSETCAVIEASLASICSAEAKMLVAPKDSSAMKKAKKLKGALSALGTILVTEAQNVEKSPEIQQRHVATVAAITSTLWSMTSALETVDKECRTSSPSLIWRTELPDAWVYLVKELEPILVRILLHVLFPNGFTGLQFFSKTGTKAVEVEEDEVESNEEELLPEEAASDTSSDEESEAESEDADVQEDDDMNMDQSESASLLSVLEGRSEFVGEAFMAVAAVVKLRSLFNSPFASSTDSSFKDQGPLSMDTLLYAAYHLILGSVQAKLSNPGWLVGIIKYVGAVGSYLPSMKPFISPLDFIKLVNLHLELIGALKEKNSGDDTLEVTPIEISDWDFDVETRNSRNAGTDDLLFITQRSFESLLKYAPRQHMVLALQSVEKAVAGVWGASDRGLGSGQVGPVVAAGVDCLGLSLHAVSGKMRLHLLASHCPAFYGGLYNLIAHCQGPSIFLENSSNAAAVVLRSLEILTTLAARAVIFPMKAGSVAMALQCPGMLFRSFLDVGKAKASWKHGLQTPLKGPTFNDKSVKLYVACCRLLCALLRHRIRECGHSMALLGESCRVLLHCLTAPSLTDAADATSAALAAQCGSWLSRVYQEMETHKETMGKYCSHLLADYLNVISGQSLGDIGLQREVDSAVRPGAFALLDACSGNDLQQLHAALGEGARRSALMTLRHDYDLHYKYTGKV